MVDGAYRPELPLAQLAQLARTLHPVKQSAPVIYQTCYRFIVIREIRGEKRREITARKRKHDAPSIARTCSEPRVW